MRLKHLAIGGLAALALSGCGKEETPIAPTRITYENLKDLHVEDMHLYDSNQDGIVERIDLTPGNNFFAGYVSKSDRPEQGKTMGSDLQKAADGLMKSYKEFRFQLEKRKYDDETGKNR